MLAIHNSFLANTKYHGKLDMIAMDMYNLEHSNPRHGCPLLGRNQAKISSVGR
jgi:hypothetical protein